jgi:hypothetical protein
MKKCFNPHCNNLHEWEEENIKTYGEAICKSCSSQLAVICLTSRERYEELNKYFSDLYFTMSEGQVVQ